MHPASQLHIWHREKVISFNLMFMMMTALLMTIAFFGMYIYSIAGDVCDDDDCIIWYICMLYVRAGEGKLSWDGMKNVKNFNISP